MHPAWPGVLDRSSLRLIAPEASRVEDYTQPFIALDWPGLPASTALAAMLEQGSPYPIQIGWGDYLLAEAAAQGYARPLLTGGNAPQGYLIDPRSVARDHRGRGQVGSDHFGRRSADGGYRRGQRECVQRAALGVGMMDNVMELINWCYRAYSAYGQYRERVTAITFTSTTMFNLTYMAGYMRIALS